VKRHSSGSLLPLVMGAGLLAAIVVPGGGPAVADASPAPAAAEPSAPPPSVAPAPIAAEATSTTPAASPEPREKPLQYAVVYRLDARSGAGPAEPALQLGGLEAEYMGSYGRKWEFAGQVPLSSQFASRGRGMHFGNLFFVRKWRLGAPTVKFGQFVVPFSNLTSYDVHSRLIQTLFRYSLGVRIDPGVEVEGYLPGETEWQVALTTGNGPYRMDRDSTPLVTGRISHKFERGGNAIKLGLSAAGGILPVFAVSGEPISVDGAHVMGWTNKRRLALDGEVERGIDLFRFEGVVGTDGGRAARGLWAGWTRPISAKTTFETAGETWHQPEGEGRLWGLWLGGEYRLDGARTARAALRWSRSRDDGRYQSGLSLVGQYVRQF
jgi:hypothetical protein